VLQGIMESFISSFITNLIIENRYLIILEGLLTTLLISVLAVILGIVLGSGVCSMRMSSHKILSKFAKIYVSILQGTPVLVLLMLIFYVVFASVNINPIFVAVIAFGLNFAAYSSEIFRNGINSVPPTQSEAGLALGFSRKQSFIHIILPQAVKRIVPVLKGEIITLLKSTSVVGFIAVHDLARASDLIRARTFDPFFPLILIAVIYFLLSKIFSKILDYAGDRILKGGRR